MKNNALYLLNCFHFISYFILAWIEHTYLFCFIFCCCCAVFCSYRFFSLNVFNVLSLLFLAHLILFELILHAPERVVGHSIQMFFYSILLTFSLRSIIAFASLYNAVLTLNVCMRLKNITFDHFQDVYNTHCVRYKY